MKNILGCIRRADERHGLIENGDKIAVGVSGGKDSMIMLLALEYYRKYFSHKDFSILAVTLKVFDNFGEADIVALRKSLNIPIVRNPCPACGKTQRAKIKELVSTMEESIPNASGMLLSAITNNHRYHLSE